MTKNPTHLTKWKGQIYQLFCVTWLNKTKSPIRIGYSLVCYLDNYLPFSVLYIRGGTKVGERNVVKSNRQSLWIENSPVSGRIETGQKQGERSQTCYHKQTQMPRASFIHSINKEIFCCWEAPEKHCAKLLEIE